MRPALLALAALCALALVGCSSGTDRSTPDQDVGLPSTRTVGRSPVALAAGEGGVWVVDDRERSLRRFAPSPLRRVGGPVALLASPVDVAAGARAVWIAARSPSVLLRVDPRTGRPAGRTLLPGEPVAVAVDAGARAVWVALRRPDAVVAAGDGGGAWFAQGDSAAYGRVPVEGDYLDLLQSTRTRGSVDVAVGPRGAVYVLTGTDSRSESRPGTTEGSYTVYFRSILRLDPRSGEVVGSDTAADDATALAVGEGRAWVLEGAAGDAKQVFPVAP